jgi:S-formylglutathione hydrolase
MMLAKKDTWRCFDGTLSVFEHASQACSCDMRFAVFAPPQAQSQRVPVLWYLSGLTCTWENVMTKAGLQRTAAALGLMVIAPDTSPRGDDVPDDPAYDLGKGAGFYLTATQEPWAKHYRMDQYIVDELQRVVAENFPAADLARQGITGHSMGGHGALTLHLKHPQRYRSASAFSPIVAPSQVPWGIKALGGYLGSDRQAWRKHDAVALIEDGARVSGLLVDYGDADPFLTEQLRPELLQAACEKAKIPLTLRRQPGYDHSYYFISTFMSDHLRWHAERLKG